MVILFQLLYKYIHPKLWDGDVKYNLEKKLHKDCASLSLCLAYTHIHAKIYVIDQEP